MVIAATPADVERWRQDAMKYCPTDNFEAAAGRLYLSDVRLVYTTAPDILFEFRDLEDDKHSRDPLLLTTAKAKALFGERYENRDEGFVDFPSFRGVNEDARRLFLDLCHDRRELHEIRVGENLTKLAEKFPERFVEETQANFFTTPPDLSAYRDIIDNSKELTENRKNLLKVVNTRIIIWLDSMNRGRECYCGLKPALFQRRQSRDLFYGCVKSFYDKENICRHGCDLWMSRYRPESDL